MKTAFLFPGQGSQTVGMGKDVYADFAAYAQAFDACQAGAGLDLKAACFQGNGFENGEIVQPAILAHSMGLLNVLRQAGIDSNILAGLSLGEYGALCAAGVFALDECAALVKRRGRIMDDAFPPGTAGMMSVIGLTIDEVEGILQDQTGVYVANHLSGAQIVIAGNLSDLNELKDVFEKAGAKMTVLLNVRGPSHAPMLKEAANAFYDVLKGENINPIGDNLVYAGTLGAPYDAQSDIKILLAQQMQSRLKWHDCVEHMLQSGVKRFIEIGPSNVLSKLIKRRVGKDIEIISVRDRRTLEALLQAQEGSDG